MDVVPSRELAGARSFLFVPGDRPERFPKAAAAGADVVVLDLEDAVPADRKEAARDEVAAWLAAGNRAVVRVNGVDTQWHEDDVRALGGSILGVMLPKAEPPDAWSTVRGLALIPLVETARGILGAPAMLTTPGVVRPAFGSIDLAEELGVDPDDREGLLWARSCLVMAAATARSAPPVDGVTTSLKDPSVLAADLAAARRIGMTAKLCIHPSQVAAVHDGLRPSADEVAWARQVVTAAADGGAVAVGGHMVDAPVLARAKRILDLA